MITGKEVEIVMNNVFNYLDTIDLLPHVKAYKGYEVWKLMKILDITYPYQDKYSNTLFDAITEDEFADYLRKRYQIDIEERTEIYLYIKE